MFEEVKRNKRINESILKMVWSYGNYGCKSVS